MLILAPPPLSPPPKRSSRPSGQPGWKERLVRSRYFLVAFLVHVVVLMLIGGLIISPKPPDPDYPPTVDILEPPGIDITKMTTDDDLKTDENEISTDFSKTPSREMEVILDQPSNTDKMPSPGIDLPVRPTPPRPPELPKSNPHLSMERGEKLRNFFREQGPNKKEIKGQTPGTLKGSFYCYIAQYAGGDWNAGLERPTGIRQQFRGSLPNLIKQVKEWSYLEPILVPTPLKLDSQEIFDKHPPFIFFTGHKDFQLTEKEVENLARYVFEGGVIWGDNALAGSGSRFDVAFRREMKRVIPDEDKPFEIVPDDHPLYTKGYFKMSGAPAGMNFYQEPLEMIRLDGEIAVLYTPNDYGDMMRMAFKDKTMDPLFSPQSSDPFATPQNLWNDRFTFYRGFEPQGTEEVFKLGLNIMSHLFTRFRDKSNNP